jgi:hypothetical protein
VSGLGFRRMRRLFRWITALGNRVLRGAEWELFRVGVSTLWDDIKSQEDDDEPGTTEVYGFDRLTRPERLALLAQVAKGLHDRGAPCADLTALNEAAVVAVFAQVRYLVSVEIDGQRSGFGAFSKDRPGRSRVLVLTAVRQIEPDPRADLPKASSADFSKWSDLIRTMLFRILDDIDYLAADIFLDLPPSRIRSMKALLGNPRISLLGNTVLSDPARARIGPGRPSTDLWSSQGVAHSTVSDDLRQRRNESSRGGRHART